MPGLADHPAGAATPPARTAWLAAWLAACCVAVPVALQAGGLSLREPAGVGRRAPTVVVARTDAEVVAAWRARGYVGWTVVHAGRFLHFVDDEGSRLTRRTLTEAGTGPALDRLLEAAATPADYLWTAASLRVARRLFYVSPPGALRGRLAALGRAAEVLPLRIDAAAIPRTLDALPPSLDEPVLLDVNASWFDDADAGALREALRRARLRCGLVIVSLAEDAADVSPAARSAARAFAASFAAEAGAPAP
ncbi:MAG TPA: hypothetical protein VFP50_20830 [Anaeromyxobacteraceae bacterium]|nr:hypothetical protein [Anaeromyxobacteraceae bacterium]